MHTGSYRIMAVDEFILMLSEGRNNKGNEKPSLTNIKEIKESPDFFRGRMNKPLCVYRYFFISASRCSLVFVF